MPRDKRFRPLPGRTETIKRIWHRYQTEPHLDTTKYKIIELSNVSRKEGLLALEEAAGSIDDEFLKKGIMLVVDGTDAELVRGILETDMLSMEERHKKTISFWEFWGEQGPADDRYLPRHHIH